MSPTQIREGTGERSVREQREMREAEWYGESADAIFLAAFEAYRLKYTAVSNHTWSKGSGKRIADCFARLRITSPTFGGVMNERTELPLLDAFVEFRIDGVQSARTGAFIRADVMRLACPNPNVGQSAIFWFIRKVGQQCCEVRALNKLMRRARAVWQHIRNGSHARVNLKGLQVVQATLLWHHMSAATRGSVLFLADAYHAAARLTPATTIATEK